MKRQRIILIVVLIFLLVGIGLVTHFVNRDKSMTQNAYAQEWVGGMVVDYLRQNNDQWPKSWEDLSPIFEQHAEKSGRPWTFEELQSRVEVKWNVDVEQLKNASSSEDSPPFPVIRLKDGTKSHWAGYEANDMVWRYFQEQKSGKES